MNSLSFCFSGTIFIALLVLKVRYAIYGILYWQLFFLRTLKVALYLLIFIVSVERSVVKPHC